MRRMNLRGIVLDYLRTLQMQGVQRLAVDDEARGILREWMLAARRGGARPVSAPPVETQMVAELQLEFALRLNVNLDEPAPAEQEQVEEIPFFRPGGANAAEAWANMRRLLPTWGPLRQLGTLREKAVLPQGNTTADIVFVGDAPGYNDEKAGLPFREALRPLLPGVCLGLAVACARSGRLGRLVSGEGSGRPRNLKNAGP